jgi:autotransporter-associated beta strand protein
MKYSSLITAAVASLIAAAAFGHGVTVNVDLNAAGTKLVVDRPVYADRDVTAITAIDQSLGYDQDDDVPGFEFSSGVQALGGVLSLQVVEPTHFWNPMSQLQATTNTSVVLDSLFYFVPAAGSVRPLNESVAGRTSISSTLPVVLVNPAAPPASDHHFAAYDLTTGAATTEPTVGAYGLVVELVDTTPSGRIASAPFIIGLNNGLTHSISSFGSEGSGDHQQPANDGTQYGAAVGAFQAQLANTVVWNYNGGGTYSEAAKWDGNPLQGAANAGTTILLAGGSTTPINASSAVITVDGAYTAGTLVLDNIGGTTYTLAGDGVNGHGLTIHNNGAGASINVVGGNHTISTNLTLGEPTVFNIASSSSLLITGGRITGSPVATPVSLTGGGTLTIDSASAYGGATTVNGGTLATTSRGSFNSGPLILNTDNYITTTAAIGNSQTVFSLAVTGDGSGSANISVAGGQTLSVQKPIALDAATTLHVNGPGRLKFAPTTGTAMVGGGATVAVATNSTLELDGAVPSLSAGVNVANDGSQQFGGALLITGTGEQVGNIDGVGDLIIGPGGALTANHIIQDALLIGGSASATGELTIAASDSAGGPLTFSATTPLSDNPSAINPMVNGAERSGSPGAVPEPATVWLSLIGMIALLSARRRSAALRRLEAAARKAARASGAVRAIA